MVFTFGADFYLGVDGTLNISKSSVTSDLEFESGIVKENGSWSSYANFSRNFKFVPPTFDNGFKAKAFVLGEIGASLYYSAGLKLPVKPFMGLDVNPKRDPWWLITGGAETKASLALEIFNRNVASREFDLFYFEDTLGFAQGTKPPSASLLASPNSGLSPLEVLLDASGSNFENGRASYQFIFDDETSYLETPETNDGNFDGKTRHTYVHGGDFRPEVIITDSLGNSDTASARIDVDEIVRDSLFDPRNDRTYEIVKIGDQWWMAESMDYWVFGESIPYDVPKTIYTWSGAKECCPEGWHLPSNSEWGELINFLGGLDSAGTKMKKIGAWGDDPFSNNLSGFSAIPRGYWQGGRPGQTEINLTGNGTLAAFPSATGFSDDNHYVFELFKGFPEVRKLYSPYDYDPIYYYVRCVKDSQSEN